MRLIDAEALIPSEVHTVVVRKVDGKEVLESVLYAEQIDNAPTIDAEPVRHGTWEWNTNNGFYYCSKCQTVSPREDQDGEYCDCPKYCPNCGARMDEVSEDETY